MKKLNKLIFVVLILGIILISTVLVIGYLQREMGPKEGEVECGYCQYLENGKCIDYSCCSDSDCDDNNPDTIDSCLNPETKQAKCKNIPLIAKTEYIVATKENDEFYNLAKYFAEKKDAELITFKNVDSMISQLTTLSPTYLAIVLSPQELTADFIDEVDEKLRTLDNDPFFDVAYGIISSFTVDEGYEYVERLLNYKTPNDFSIYGVNQGYRFRNLKNYGFSVIDRCLLGYGFVICDEENKITVDKIAEEAKNYEIVNLGLHGTPSRMILSDGESLEGSKDGLIGKKPTDEEICYEVEGGAMVCGPKMEYVPITLNAALVNAFSCLTARINGKPSIIYKEYGDSEVEGKIDTSIVLSFLKNGALNYIGSTHVASSAVFPAETLVNEAILQGIPLGLSLKNFKNNYVFNKIFQNKTLEGKPKSNDFTIGFTEFQIRNWVLFGDPSIKISNKNIKPKDCIQKYEENFVDKKNYLLKSVNIEIKFTDEDGNLLTNSHLLNIPNIPENADLGGVSGSDACAIHIPLEGELISYEVSPQGINERYSSYFKEDNIIENAGDELIILVPDYIAIGGLNGAVKLNFSIQMK